MTKAVKSEGPIVKIAVFADGRLTVNGNVSTIGELHKVLASVNHEKGAVWSYREASQKEPPPIAMEVMNAVVDARLPIRLSSRADYSDSVVP